MSSPSTNTTALDDPELYEGMTLDVARKRAEVAAVTGALERNRWSVAAAARELGMSRGGLYQRMGVLGIDRPGDGDE